MHQATEPAILYFGTPVVLISSSNEDGSANLSPISSAFWLGWRCLLGLDAGSKTPKNVLRTGQCVLNPPPDDIAGAVDRLARTTGSNPLPDGKVRRGYRFEPDKFARGGADADPVRDGPSAGAGVPCSSRRPSRPAMAWPRTIPDCNAGSSWSSSASAGCMWRRASSCPATPTGSIAIADGR